MIDLHTHIMPPDWPDWCEKFGYEGFIRIESCDGGCRARMMVGDQLFREVGDVCWAPGPRIADCDVAGVRQQVLSPIPVLFCYWAKPEHTLEFARLQNDYIAKIVREYPGRFYGLGTVPMQDPQLAIGELERCVLPPSRGGLGLSGVEIGTHVEPNRFTGRETDWNLSAPELFEFFQAAEQLQASIFVHPWDMMGADQMRRYWLPWLVGMPAETSRAICSMIFGGVHERLPGLKVCYAHGGGSFPFTLGRIEHGFDCRQDLVALDNPVNPRAYVAQPDGTPARFWVDSLTHDADALQFLRKIFSDQRICLGTDYPFPLGEQQPGSLIRSMELPDEVV